MSKRILRTTMTAIAYNNSNGFKNNENRENTEPATYNSTLIGYDTVTYSPSTILITGFMIMTALLTCWGCYRKCCRRKVKEPEDIQHQRVEPDDRNLEVFAMNAMLQHSSERSVSQTSHSTCLATPEPPPTYESIFNPRAVPAPIDKKYESDDFGIIVPRMGSFSTELDVNWINKREDIPRDDEGLPSYDAALKLEADGYV